MGATSYEYCIDTSSNNTCDRWILEVLNAIISTLQSRAITLLIFFVFALIAVVLVDSTEKTMYNRCLKPSRGEEMPETDAKKKQKKNSGKDSSLLIQFLDGSALPNGVGSGEHCSSLPILSTYRRCETYLSQAASLSEKDA